MNKVNSDIIVSAQQGNKEEMEKIIIENSGLVWSIVKRFLGRGYDKEELYQVGCVGFIKAIKRFDVNLNFELSTYAVPFIIGEIKKFIRDNGPIKVSRSIKELQAKIEELKRENLIKGKELTEKELAVKLNVDEEDIVIAINSKKAIESIDEQVYDNNEKESKISKIGIKENETNKLINKMCIEELLKKLNDKEQRIILLRYYKGKTQTEVAKELKISQVQISRMEKKILYRMRQDFKINEGY